MVVLLNSECVYLSSSKDLNALRANSKMTHRTLKICRLFSIVIFICERIYNESTFSTFVYNLLSLLFPLFLPFSHFILSFFLKLPDILYLNTTLFMYQFNNNNVANNFNDFFTSISISHHYKIRLASKSNFLFLELVPTMKNLISDLSVRKFGIPLMNYLSL